MAGPLPINDINSEQSSAGANQSEPLRVRTAPYQRICGIDRIKNNPNTYVARLLPINEINSKQLSAGTNQSENLRVQTAPYQRTCISIVSNFGLPAADGVNFFGIDCFGFEKKNRSYKMSIVLVLKKCRVIKRPFFFLLFGIKNTGLKKLNLRSPS